MSRPDWTLELIRRAFPRDMRLMAVTRLPGVGRLVERLLFEGDHLVCLPRDNTVAVERNLEEPDQMALPTRLIDTLVDRADHHFIMDFCICRRSNPCRNYPVELGCLFMGSATLDINPDWGRHVSRDQAKAHIRECQKQGLVHFVGKSKLDTVWLGAGPEAALFTICNCCPCCCITRGVPYAARRFTEKLHRAPGITVTVTEDCVGCGACTEGLCVARAISLENGTAVISDACLGCGRCAEACPANAIRVDLDEEAFFESSLARLCGIVDVFGG
ncbi:MAG: DUF362 domain-containing protein [Desulfatibacillaceae bacterium]